MESVVLVIHLILALAIIVLVLLQRSEGGGLGIGGGGGGLGGLATARGTANALTKMTGLCALGFFITSLFLAVLASQHHVSTGGILENITEVDIQAPVVNDHSADDTVNYIPPSETSEEIVAPESITNDEEVMDQVVEPTEEPEPTAPAE